MSTTSDYAGDVTKSITEKLILIINKEFLCGKKISETLIYIS